MGEMAFRRFFGKKEVLFYQKRNQTGKTGTDREGEATKRPLEYVQAKEKEEITLGRSAP